MQPTFEHYSPDMVTVIEADGTIRYQGPAVERVLGYGPGEQVGKSVYEFLHPEDLARGEAALLEVLDTPGVGPAFEFRWRHKEGGWRWLESVGNNLLSDPEVRAIVSSSRDVTVKKETEARYRALVESLPAGVLVEDEAGRVLSANPRFREMFGAEAPSGGGASGGRPESRERKESPFTDPEGVAARAEELLRGREPVTGDGLTLADGRFFERDYTPVSVGGRYRGHVWIYRDVTARKRAEVALAGERNLLRTIVDSAHDFIFAKDLDHRFLLSNRRHLEALGLAPRGEVLGRTNADFWGEEAEPFLEDDRRVMDLGETLAGREEEVRLPSGERLWLSTTKVPLTGEDGRIEGLVGVSRDISDRRAAEEGLKESERLLRTVTTGAPVVLFALDADETVTLVTGRGLAELGIDPDRNAGHPLTAGDFGQPEILRNVRRTLSGEEVRAFVGIRGRTFDARYSPLRADGSARSGRGAVVGAIGVATDVTDQRRAEEALRESEDRYRNVVEQSVEGIFLFDPGTGRILESNAALRELLGYRAEELLTMSIYEVIAHDREEIDRSVREDLLRRRRLAGERRYRRRDGTLVEVEVGMTVVPYRGREALCSVVRDLTERKRLERELRHKATHDPLTGLPNRALFMERLSRALERERRSGGRAAVLYLDLDGFKAVNDRYGHDAGDRLLVTIADRLRQGIRPGDTVCRLGGDEFLVLLEEATPEHAEEIARRLLEELGSLSGSTASASPESPASVRRWTPVEGATGGVGDAGARPGGRITASIGLAFSGEAGYGETVARGARPDPPAGVAEVAEALIRRADDAMYRAKQNGNGVFGA